MDSQQLMSVIALTSILIAVISGITCLSLARKLHNAESHQTEIESTMNLRFSEIKDNLDAVLQQTNEQWNQLSQFEMAFEQEPFSDSLPEDPSGQSALLRQSMTERRHQVLTLARRGMDVQNIAMTLGVPRGEVALIIGMNTSNMKV